MGGPVKQQGSCGSCWAFAANSALEGYVAKKNNAAPVRMSEQHLVDCTLTNNSYNESLFGKTYGLWGCNGGWMSYAWWIQKEQGVMMDSDYPYTSGRTGRETQCAHDATKTKGKVTQWGQIRNSIDDVKTKLKTHPMTIAIDAGDGVFQFYKNGVIARDAGCGTGLNHAVVLLATPMRMMAALPLLSPTLLLILLPVPLLTLLLASARSTSGGTPARTPAMAVVCKRTRTVTTTTGRSKTPGEPTGATKVSFSSRLPRALASAA